MVMTREDNTTPRQWPLGRIIEFHAGKDQIVHAVTVSLGASVVRRNDNKLCVLLLNELLCNASVFL